MYKPELVVFKKYDVLKKTFIFHAMFFCGSGGLEKPSKNRKAIHGIQTINHKPLSSSFSAVGGSGLTMCGGG
jgi:hypothetical protein